MTHSNSITALRAFAPRRRPRIVPAVCQRLRTWHERARQRQELLQLDERQRRDVGVTREEAVREARKPFWRA